MKYKDILMDKGKMTHEIAKAFAESEFEKYRINYMSRILISG